MFTGKKSDSSHVNLDKHLHKFGSGCFISVNVGSNVIVTVYDKIAAVATVHKRIQEQMKSLMLSYCILSYFQ